MRLVTHQRGQARHAAAIEAGPAARGGPVLNHGRSLLHEMRGFLHDCRCRLDDIYGILHLP